MDTVTETLAAKRLERIAALEAEIAKRCGFRNEWRMRVINIPEMPENATERERKAWSESIDTCARIADEHARAVDDLERRRDALLAVRD